MTAPAPPTFPTSRTLANWGRQLAPLHPRAVWLTHLLLHRVEALVRLTRPVRPDRFTLLALEPLALVPEPTLERVQALLPLDRPTLHQVLRGLETAGLAACATGGCWRLTDLGRRVRSHGEYACPVQERRAFYFL